MEVSNKKLTVRLAKEWTMAANMPKRCTEDTIYHEVAARVEMAAKNGRDHVVFTIPPFTVGLPVYDAATVRNRIAHRFHDDGFVVKVSDPAYLYLSWGVRMNSNPKKKKKEQEVRFRV